MSDLAIQLYEAFHKEFPYLGIDMDTVIDFMEIFETVDLDMFIGYVLLQGCYFCLN